MQSTLLAGGCGFDDIVDVTTFHTNPERQLDTMMTVKGEVFKCAPYPSWTAEPGHLAFLSGQIAAKPGSDDMPKDVGGQAKLVTASLGVALNELKVSAQDIVMMRVYIVNATTEAFQQVLTALRELLGESMPSMTTIGVQALYTPEIKVEIEIGRASPLKRESPVTVIAVCKKVTAKSSGHITGAYKSHFYEQLCLN